MTTTTASLLADVRAAIDAAPSRDAAMTQAVALLKARQPHYTWVGIYLLEGDTLVLGPFLGKPSPHTRIPLGRGICGAAASEKATIVVDDVNSDPRYLACSIETRSEIVVPIRRAVAPAIARYTCRPMRLSTSPEQTNGP